MAAQVTAGCHGSRSRELLPSVTLPGKPGMCTLVLAHLALAAANSLLGIGSVVSKIGLAGCNPVIFTLLREMLAAPLLFWLSVLLEGPARKHSEDATRELLDPRRRSKPCLSMLDMVQFGLAGAFLFGTNLGYIIGVKFLGATPAAIWQSSLPIFTSIIAVAVGMGAYGLRPVPEIQFADYIYPGLDQLISEAARLRYRSAGEYVAPMTVRSPFGGGIFGGQTHSQSPEAIFTHVSGLKTVIPATPYDAKGLLISCIEDNDPVIFFEPKRIYNGPFSGYYDKPVQPWKKFDASVVPEGYYKIPLGKARQVTEGDRLTVLAYGTMVHVVEAVCREKGVEADILDLRTLVPLDIEAIEASIERTGRCLIVHEATRTSGFGAELSALVTERCFYHLEAPVERVTGFDTPYPHSLEWAYFPGPIRIGEAIDKILKD